ncbi:MAG: AAA family ATPase [Gammaproteobacteria bacterium]|nr:AAA family ATPase [Gammaproteobacteria bacterium]
MSTPVLTFFNNKGGVGKTSLIYHLAWMFASLHKRVVIIDLDPQANLTAAFLDEEKIEAIWNQPTKYGFYHQCVKPLTGVGDIAEPVLQNIAADLYLLPGDVNLSGYEDTLSAEWPNSMGDNNLYRPMRILSSFWQVMQMAGADLFSLQGLKNLGPTLRIWKSLWQKRLDNWEGSAEKSEYPDFNLPQGQMKPIGYLCQQHSVRLDRPVKAYVKWVQRIPAVYRKSVLNRAILGKVQPEDDPHCLATIKRYRSLIPMAQEHRKPIFNLTSADGAIGAHANAVQDAKKDFKLLAEKIAAKMKFTI